MTQIKSQYIPAPLRSAVKGGCVTFADEILDENKGKSQERINDELYNLIGTPRTKSVLTYATEDTTSVEEVLPAVGSVDTLYRVGNWDGTEYNSTKMADYGWNGYAYTLLYVNDYTIDIEPTPNSTNIVTSGGVAAVEGYYIDNPEFVRIYLDANGRIVKAIRKDGTVYVALGIEINGNIITTTDNPEFIKIYIDSCNHILWALTKTGDVFYGAGVPSQIVKFVEDTIKPFKDLFSYIDDPEFIEIKLDALDRILEGYKINGNKYFASPVENGAAVISAINCPEFIALLIDAKNRIINSIDKELENIRYGGISLTEIKQDLDAQVLEVHIDEDNNEIYTIENNDSTITLEIDDEWNVYEVKDSTCPYELSESEEGEVFIEETLNEI